jgi:3-oxo-5alpha-steroid 4-dehydrogenase
MISHHGGRAWLILDRTLRAQATRQCLWGGLWAFQSVPALTLMWLHARKAPTVAALAARIGADPQTLQNSLDQANAAAQGQGEDPVGKSTGMRHAMPEGPYFALDISIGSPVFPLATLTLGGLVLDESSGQVRDAQGAPIAGLYGAGRAAVGLASGRYVSGLSLADCVFSGRRAGKAAACGTA